MMLLLICSWVVGGIFLLAALYGFVCIRNLKVTRDELTDEYLDMTVQLDREYRENHRLTVENSRLRTNNVLISRKVDSLHRDVSDAHTCLELVLNYKPAARSRRDPHQATLFLLP